MLSALPNLIVCILSNKQSVFIQAFKHNCLGATLWETQKEVFRNTRRVKFTLTDCLRAKLRLRVLICHAGVTPRRDHFTVSGGRGTITDHSLKIQASLRRLSANPSLPLKGAVLALLEPLVIVFVVASHASLVASALSALLSLLHFSSTTGHIHSPSPCLSLAHDQQRHSDRSGDSHPQQLFSNAATGVCARTLARL